MFVHIFFDECPHVNTAKLFLWGRPYKIHRVPSYTTLRVSHWFQSRIFFRVWKDKETNETIGLKLRSSCRWYAWNHHKKNMSAKIWLLCFYFMYMIHDAIPFKKTSRNGKDTVLVFWGYTQWYMNSHAISSIFQDYTLRFATAPPVQTTLPEKFSMPCFKELIAVLSENPGISWKEISQVL